MSSLSSRASGKADLIVPEGGRNLVALELLIKWVDNHLHNAE